MDARFPQTLGKDGKNYSFEEKRKTKSAEKNLHIQFLAQNYIFVNMKKLKITGHFYDKPTRIV